jgi:hypothetical protein
MSGVQVKVALDKAKHPEKFCPKPKCLWRTGGGYCPRHIKGEQASWQQHVELNMQGRVYSITTAHRVAEQLNAAYINSPYSFEVIEGGTFGRIEVSAGCAVLGYY